MASLLWSLTMRTVQDERKTDQQQDTILRAQYLDTIDDLYRLRSQKRSRWAEVVALASALLGASVAIMLGFEKVGAPDAIRVGLSLTSVIAGAAITAAVFASFRNRKRFKQVERYQNATRQEATRIVKRARRAAGV
jgi:hypothetical protein